MKVLFIDQTSEKQHHMIFNASFIDVLNNVFNPDSIEYYGIRSNQKNAIIYIECKDKVILHSIFHFKFRFKNFILKSILLFFKEIFRFFSITRIFFSSNRSDILCLSISSIFSQLYFKIISLFFKNKVYFIIHGDVDFVFNSSSKIEKLFALIYKFIFKFKSDNFKYILINKISKFNLINLEYLNESEIIELNHPIVTTSTFKYKKNISKPVRIGHIGSMEFKRKNSHLLFELSSEFRHEIDSNSIVFYAIGLLTNDVLSYINKDVVQIYGNDTLNIPSYLGREVYESSIEALDYSIFFYDKEQYFYRTSGAVLDSIIFLKPIIAFKHPYFEYLSNSYGPIGYFVDDLAGMKNIILQLLNHDLFEQNQKDYDIFMENLMSLKKNIFSIKAVSNDFKNQLKC